MCATIGVLFKNHPLSKPAPITRNETCTLPRIDAQTHLYAYTTAQSTRY